MSVIQVDPAGCGCTECITGLYVPVDIANRDQLVLAAVGVLGNASGIAGEELWEMSKEGTK